MPAFKCERCFRIFNLKTDLQRHIQKKYPCVTEEENFSGMEGYITIGKLLRRSMQTCNLNSIIELDDSLFNMIKHYHRDKFDFVMTNPPFGVKSKRNPSKEELLLTIIKHYF